MLNGPFFREDYQSLTFTTYSDNSVEGIKTDGFLQPGNGYNQTIKLNVAALQYASEEYIAAVIYHEILHSYLLIQGITTENAQHEEMALNWKDDMSAQLRIDFPNLSKADADAMVWGGLGDTTSWGTVGTNDYKNSIVDVNKNFKNVNNSINGNYGTPCTN